MSLGKVPMILRAAVACRGPDPGNYTITYFCNFFNLHFFPGVTLLLVKGSRVSGDSA